MRFFTHTVAVLATQSEDPALEMAWQVAGYIVLAGLVVLTAIACYKLWKNR